MESKNYFNIFCELVADQFRYGGKKYAYSGTRESTDVLFDKHGKNWLFGTIDKYTFRFKNCKREKDLLKIACYMYILWLKRGFYIMERGINDPAIDTNVKTKLEQYTTFLKKLEGKQQFIDGLNLSNKEMEESKVPTELLDETTILTNNPDDLYFTDSFFVQATSRLLGRFSEIEWKDISESDLIKIFAFAYTLWYRNFKDKAGQDTDTWLEDKFKNEK
ncbi:MAG: hypothetical protein ACTSPD_10105 [Promethearchaeota archaeon]